MSSKKELLDFIDSASAVPIYLAATHGSYELRDIDREDQYTFVVPKNTYIFEVADVGEYTLTSIDSYLWNLVQDRSFFKMCIDVDKIDDEEVKKYPNFSRVFRHLHYYCPGDKIGLRKLSLGKREEFDNAWGYYKFVKGDPYVKFPENITSSSLGLVVPKGLPNPPVTPLMKALRDYHYEGARLRSADTKETSNKELIEKIRAADTAAPAIFVFNSCAAYDLSRKNEPEYKTNRNKELSFAKELGNIQQRSAQRMAEWGLIGPGTTAYSNNNATKNVLKPIATRRVRRTLAPVEEFLQVKNKGYTGLSNYLKSPKEFVLPTEEEEEILGNINAKDIPSRFSRPDVPANVFSVFTKVGDSYYVKANPLRPENPTWFSRSEAQDLLTKNPAEELYRVYDGDFIKIGAGETLKRKRGGKTRRKGIKAFY
jgi:hypothetical protein